MIAETRGYWGSAPRAKKDRLEIDKECPECGDALGNDIRELISGGLFCRNCNHVDKSPETMAAYPPDPD